MKVKSLLFTLSILFLFGCSSIYDFMFDAGADNSKPFIVMETPVNGSKVATNLSVTGSAKGVRAKLKRITIYYQSTNGSISGNAPAGLFLGKFTSSVDLSSYGFFYIWAEAEDELGNLADTSANKVLINAANIPIIQFSVPVSNGRDHFTNVTTVPVTLSSSIVGAQVTNLRLIVNYGSGPDSVIDLGNTNSMISNLVLSNNLTNLISAIAASDNGETSQTQFVRLFIDTVQPNIYLDTPTNGQFVNNQFTVTVTANDPQISGIDRVELYIDGTNRGQSSEYPYSVTWDTSSDPEAAHSVLVKAYDLAGNTKSASNMVSIMQAVCVSVGSGSDANFGYKTSPMQTVYSAITQAVRLGINQVYVSAETYTPGSGLWTTNQGVTLTNFNEFNLKGGYNSGFTSQTGYSELDGMFTLNNVIMVNFSSNVLIDRFLVRNGIGQGTVYNRQGAGICFRANKSVITNCVISNCYSYSEGGGVYANGNYNSFNGIIINCTASNDGGYTPDLGGGGICAIGNYFTLTGGLYSNFSYYNEGGGATVNGHYPTVNIDAAWNKGSYGSALHIDGSFGTIKGFYYTNMGGFGAIYLEGGYGHNDFDVQMISNCSGGNGGGMCFGNDVNKCNNNTIKGLFAYNTGLQGSVVYGGGLCIDGSYNTISADFIGNFAYCTSTGTGGTGGAIYINGDFNVISNQIISNKANGNFARGGGLMINGNNNTIISRIDYNEAFAYGGSYGGGLFLLGGNNNYFTGSISHNRIYNGSSWIGNGIYLGIGANDRFINCVITNNTGPALDMIALVYSSSPLNLMFSNCIIGAVTNGANNCYTFMERNGSIDLQGIYLVDNIFITNGMKYLYYDFAGSNIITNGVYWTNINANLYTGAAQASGNIVTNY